MTIRVLGLVLLAASACRPDPGLDTAQATLVTRYLECIECIGGELGAVVRLARQHPAASDTLRMRMLDGAAAGRAAQLAASYGARWTRDTAVSRERGDTVFGRAPGDSARYVDGNVRRHDVLVRVRAAVALGCTGMDDSLGVASAPSATIARQVPIGRRLLGAVADSLRSPAYRDRACR